MSEGGDPESWDDEMMMNENNETPLPVVRPTPYLGIFFPKSRNSLFCHALLNRPSYDDVKRQREREVRVPLSSLSPAG